MVVRKQTDFEGQQLIMETGKLAKQANGACWVQLGDTVVLAAVVADKKASEERDFFPLTVDYREKAYAAGKIPGGFFKREGKPTDGEVLSARLIDRSIRPLFAKSFRNEVQVYVWVLSADKINDADVLGITAASLALGVSDIPFQTPIAGVRIGRVEGRFIANPTFEQQEESDIDLVLSASEDSIVMVEGEAREISEEDMIAALEYGHDAIRRILALESQVVAEAGKTKMTLPEPEEIPGLVEAVTAYKEELARALRVKEKEARREGLAALSEKLQADLAESFPEKSVKIAELFHDLEKSLMREMVLQDKSRLDGRGLSDIRDISIEVGLLPRTHGSALFTRGQTQALASVTLGTKVDEQRIEELEGEFRKTYMLHYNFPSFCTGEVKPNRGVSRREVGHGNLAERAIKQVMPTEKLFPYTVRIVSDVLESNGSSSMATVCAGSLACMDAGVPIKSPVAGIAMGLIKEGDQVAVLTDILGDEDHMGDMDFKVAGTREGITAFQMDIKIKGISTAVMREALQRAQAGRIFILDKMTAVIDKPRAELSNYAPRIVTIKIPVDSIGLVIGPGGKNIREIVERTETTIDINDDGTVTIAAVDPAACEKASSIIKAMTAEVEVGTVYTGKVKKIAKFGAFVEVLPGREGLLHVSEIEHRRVERVEDVLKVGDEVQVKVMKIDGDGKIDLSRKVLLERPAGAPENNRPPHGNR
ncbi:MAG TPA: polyribonucleotide nucleotidyltransferase [bacterium]|nr:polyribonucleotide nucleotidyltransferase [bacterium]HQI48197.1 polyribonucleotide nucleotidyltransferase [bacterium]HQJ64769.1 polyribonucleotide nucleotidyltransferase [bacterium]